MTVSAVLARELAAARPQFNAQVAAARRARTGFDTETFNDAVRTRIDPLAVAVDGIAPARTAAVVDAAFALNLTLTAQGLSGARRMLVDRVWREAAVPLAACVAERPEQALSMLTNAVLTLYATRGARADEWIERLRALAPQVTWATLGAVGQVLAWRSGMAHYRAAALALADGLPEALALMAIGTSGSWATVRAALAADRWWTCGPRAAAGIRFGGFIGFGGPFESPPELRASAHDFFVRSGRNTGLLIADACGATLHPAAEQDYERATPAAATQDTVAGFPNASLQAATAGDSVAIASPYSHFILVRPATS